MKPGEMVEAKIEKIEKYGLYLKYDEKNIIVLGPDASTQRPLELESMFVVGDKISVKIIRFIPEADIYKGTIISVPETENISG
jgi:ribosomal protein S1